jgi:hypothetical protein
LIIPGRILRVEWEDRSYVEEVKEWQSLSVNVSSLTVKMEMK